MTDQSEADQNGGEQAGAEAAEAAAAAQAAEAAAQADAGKQAVSGDEGNGADSAEQQGIWPENWREQIAGEDKKLLKDLQKVRDPKALNDRYRALRSRMDAGELLTPYPAEGTEEEQAKWRESNGIPAEPKGYLESLPDGLVLGEEDAERAEAFAEAMFAHNARPEVVHEALGFHYKMLENQQAERMQKDDEQKNSLQEELIADMGLADYRRSVSSLVSWAESLPDGAGETILNARGPDGTALLNDPAVARALMQVVRELNPVHTVVPGAGADGVQAIADEIADLEKMMGNKNSDYWKGPRSEQLQARYRELVDARNALEEKAA